MSKEKRNLSDLTGLIGKVEINPKVIQEATQEINVKNIKETPVQQNIDTGHEINLKTPKTKVPESFKIAPELKKTVEELVEQLRASGEKATKGKVYNYLIGTGLKALGK